MELMTLEQQQTQVQNNQGYFKMEDAPTHEEYITAIEAAFEEAIAQHWENQ